MGKMKKKWVVLCSTAIAAVYTAGYVNTEAEANAMQQPHYTHTNYHKDANVTMNSQQASDSKQTGNDQQTSHSQAAKSKTVAKSQVTANSHVATNNQTPIKKQVTTKKQTAVNNRTITNTKRIVIKHVQPKPASMYKDGTFYGVGSNRRGSIQVAVKIKNDKIIDVGISDFEMHYSENDIVGLPQEVIRRQSARVDNVSGATYSTEAFHDGVVDALSQARN